MLAVCQRGELSRKRQNDFPVRLNHPRYKISEPQKKLNFRVCGRIFRGQFKQSLARTRIGRGRQVLLLTKEQMERYA